MTLHAPSRRGFITGLGAFFCASPAIVRASSLMPVKAMEDCAFEFSPFYTAYPIPLTRVNYQELVRITREMFASGLYFGTYYFRGVDISNRSE